MIKSNWDFFPEEKAIQFSFSSDFEVQILLTLRDFLQFQSDLSLVYMIPQNDVVII